LSYYLPQPEVVTTGKLFNIPLRPMVLDYRFDHCPTVGANCFEFI